MARLRPRVCWTLVLAHVGEVGANGYLASLRSPDLPSFSTPGLPMPLTLKVPRKTGPQALRAVSRLQASLCPWPWLWWAVSLWVSENGWATEGGTDVRLCGWGTQDFVPEVSQEPPGVLCLCPHGHRTGEIVPAEGKGWEGREEGGPDLL